jgi:hypothetical protein
VKQSENRKPPPDESRLPVENKPPAETESHQTTTLASGSAVERWADWLTQVASPGFGQCVTWLLLVFAIVLAISPIEFASGIRSDQAATIFAWLPEGLLRNPFFFTSVRVMLIVSVVCWAACIAVPISCWATTILFALMWSLRMENLTNGAHIFNVTNMLLLIHAMWFQFYHRDIRIAKSQGTFWQAPTYPRWVFLLSVFYLGWFHSLAGFTKIFESGFGWGNGVSLQLWTQIFGETSTPFAQIILYDSRLTAWLQRGALAIECLSILAIFHRLIRYAVGLGLVGFYVGVLTTFVTFGFHFNAILVALFLLPVDWWTGLKFESTSQPTLRTADCKKNIS